MATQPASLNWFAVRVKSNREHITSLGLEGRGYEVFLPQHGAQRNHRQSKLKAPLLPGYLFCRFDVTQRLPVLTLPGVVHIVGFGNVPVPVDEREIESLRVLVRTGVAVNTAEPYTVGRNIRIVRGPLSGAEGVVAGLRDKRLVVSITLLQRSVSVVLDPDWLTPGLDACIGEDAPRAAYARSVYQ